MTLNKVSDSVLNSNKLGNLTSLATTDKTSLVNAINENFNQIGNLSSIATLTSAQYNILGDGTDETAKIVSMIAAIPANGAKLIFDKTKQINVNGTSLININNKQNVVIEGLNLTGTSGAVILVSNGSKNITFRDCIFKDASQVILLFACEQIVIDNCTFDHTGYGIIQQNGYVSNNVKVINCTARNMLSDFIELNCESLNPSKNWIVANNHYLGNTNYPTTGTETRFFGATYVENIIIARNIIEKSTGDHAIHLEGGKGDIIITNNIMDNCVGSDESPYICILNNEKTAIIKGNIFKRTDVSLAATYVINTNVGTASTYPIHFVNNRIIGTNKNLGIRSAYHSNFLISGNWFEQCDIAIVIDLTKQGIISNNFFKDNNYGIKSDEVATGGANDDITISSNRFVGTVNKCVNIKRNTNGLGPSSRILVNGNYFDNDAVAYDTIDCTFVNNVGAAGKSLSFGLNYYSTSTGYLSANNRLAGGTAFF